VGGLLIGFMDTTKGRKRYAFSGLIGGGHHSLTGRVLTVYLLRLVVHAPASL
jgi:hypothetical protein